MQRPHQLVALIEYLEIGPLNGPPRNSLGQPVTASTIIIHMLPLPPHFHGIHHSGRMDRSVCSRPALPAPLWWPDHRPPPAPHIPTTVCSTPRPGVIWTRTIPAWTARSSRNSVAIAPLSVPTSWRSSRRSSRSRTIRAFRPGNDWRPRRRCRRLAFRYVVVPKRVDKD